MKMLKNVKIILYGKAKIILTHDLKVPVLVFFFYFGE